MVPSCVRRPRTIDRGLLVALDFAGVVAFLPGNLDVKKRYDPRLRQVAACIHVSSLRNGLT
jgi:hypothetical protein